MALLAAVNATPNTTGANIIKRGNTPNTCAPDVNSTAGVQLLAEQRHDCGSEKSYKPL